MNTSRRVGFFLTGIGFISVISLFLREFYSGESLLHLFKSPNIYLVFSVSLIFLILSFSKNSVFSKINRLLQFYVFIIFASIATIDDVKSWYGIGLFTLAIILGINYGFFQKRRLLKMILIFSTIAFIAEYSIMQNQNEDIIGLGFEILFFMGFFFGIMFLCYYDDLHMTIGKVERLKKDKECLEKRMKEDLRQIEKLQGQIDILEKTVKPFDLTSCKLTKAEMKVLEHLVLYRASNADIAEKLNKSEITVKIQMKSIFDKLGADNRYQVIDLCRYNFT